MGLSCSHSEGNRAAAIAQRATIRVLPVFLIALLAVAMPSPSALGAQTGDPFQIYLTTPSEGSSYALGDESYVHFSVSDPAAVYIL